MDPASRQTAQRIHLEAGIEFLSLCLEGCRPRFSRVPAAGRLGPPPPFLDARKVWQAGQRDNGRIFHAALFSQQDSWAAQAGAEAKCCRSQLVEIDLEYACLRHENKYQINMYAAMLQYYRINWLKVFFFSLEI